MSTPCSEIVQAMGVTRATVSGLMAGMEREGLVESAVDRDDRRKLIARLTARGEIIVNEAFGVAMARFGKLFASFSREELTTLTALLTRVREEIDHRDDQQSEPAPRRSRSLKTRRFKA